MLTPPYVLSQFLMAAPLILLYGISILVAKAVNPYVPPEKKEDASEDILEKFHVDPEDTHAFINHLLVLDNIKVACMFREMGEQIKVSLRSTGEVDVGVMAQALGGGGHDHSAATLIKGSLESVVKSTIDKLQAMLKEAEIKKN